MEEDDDDDKHEKPYVSLSKPADLQINGVLNSKRAPDVAVT